MITNPSGRANHPRHGLGLSAPELAFDSAQLTTAGSIPSQRVRCPRGSGDSFLLRQQATGRLISPMCGANTCSACLPHNASNVRIALNVVRPEYMVTIGQVGHRWDLVQKRMNRFNQKLRRFAGSAVQHAYHVEPYPLGDQCHIHGWLWGEGVAFDAVTNAAESVGLGADVVLERADPNREFDYALKMVRRDPREVPGRDLWPDARRFLGVNGGRLVHATYGYWRDGSTGERLDGMDHAIRTGRAAKGLGGALRPAPLDGAA